MDMNEITWVRRDTFEKGKMNAAGVAKEIPQVLAFLQQQLLEKSKKIKDDLTTEANNFDEYKNILETKRSFVRVFWCEEAECEAKVKQETKSTTRCLELENIDMNESAICFHCGKPAKRKWLFGMSY